VFQHMRNGCSQNGASSRDNLRAMGSLRYGAPSGAASHNDTLEAKARALEGLYAGDFSNALLAA